MDRKGNGTLEVRKDGVIFHPHLLKNENFTIVYMIQWMLQEGNTDKMERCVAELYDIQSMQWYIKIPIFFSFYN